MDATKTATEPPASHERVTLPVTGMTCAACSSRIERTLKRADGVLNANVNFANHRATVEYDPHVTDTAALGRTSRLRLSSTISNVSPVL